MAGSGVGAVAAADQLALESAGEMEDASTGVERRPGPMRIASVWSGAS
jgi:hypothetical protein